MADDLRSVSIKPRVSAEEWQVRVDLAALYRLVALYGWDDMIFTHISARVPGPEHHFLINPYGFFFNEITASSLVKVDLDGNIVEPTDYFINPAGLHHPLRHPCGARGCEIRPAHVHTDAGIAVVCDQGRPAADQPARARPCCPNLAYHEYEGIALDLDERERLVKDLGDKIAMMLWNHGTLAVGETAAQCWLASSSSSAPARSRCWPAAQGREHLRMAPTEAKETVKRADQRHDGHRRDAGLAGMPAQARSGVARL